MNKSKTAVLIVNLGSPESPTPASVKTFLREFLSDKRVIEVNPLVWKFILNCFILPKRSVASAQRYKSIWTKEGSPQIVLTDKIVKGLNELFKQQGSAVTVHSAMRYGKPSISDVIKRLHEEEGVQNILIAPLNPQYSATTTGSIMDVVCDTLKTMRSQPSIRVLRDFFDREEFIDSVADSIKNYWAKKGKIGPNDKLVLSFHGMPVSYIEKGDPYKSQVEVSTRLISEKLDIPESSIVQTFQSRFGKDLWLTPYTDVTLDKLAKDGVKRVDIACPCFVTDCLETLEEIQTEGKETFKKAGGKEFNYIPCVNHDEGWLKNFHRLLSSNLQGW